MKELAVLSDTGIFTAQTMASDHLNGAWFHTKRHTSLSLLPSRNYNLILHISEAISRCLASTSYGWSLQV